VPSYYLRYFYAHDAVLAEQRTGTPRAATVAEIERDLLALYRDPALDTKPALLEQRGGAFYSEAATALLAALVTGDGSVQVLDVRAGEALPGLAADDVVEVPARVGADGPVALAQAPLAPELLGLVQHVAAYERLAVRAALTRSPGDVRLALLAHPLIGQLDRVDGLAETLLAPAGSAA
jgi:6-phospho-beta-glucosidase